MVKFHAKVPIIKLLNKYFLLNISEKTHLRLKKNIKKKELKFVTFLGSNIDNSLKSYGDVNFWVYKGTYKIVECIKVTFITIAMYTVIEKSV